MKKNIVTKNSSFYSTEFLIPKDIFDSDISPEEFVSVNIFR